VGEGLNVSRKNKPNTHKQRSRLVANQELKRAIRAGTPESFGIRRKLDYDDEYRLRDDFKELLLDNEGMAEIIDPRESLHVTILRRRNLDSQLKRGLVVGYEFGKASARIQNEIQYDNTSRMIVEVTEPRIMKRGRAVVLAVQSPELDAEVREVMKAMASIGLKGALRNEGFKPHITLGESKRPFSRLEKTAILDTVSELSILHTLEKEVTLNRLEFYPDIRH
jgi:hypothetical protein